MRCYKYADDTQLCFSSLNNCPYMCLLFWPLPYAMVCLLRFRKLPPSWHSAKYKKQIIQERFFAAKIRLYCNKMIQKWWEVTGDRPFSFGSYSTMPRLKDSDDNLCNEPKSVDVPLIQAVIKCSRCCIKCNKGNKVLWGI